MLQPDSHSDSCKIAIFNVNSIRARLPNVVAWLQDDNPDIALLQELKCEEDKFPHDEIADLGYNIAIYGQKSYNGVAILSKFPIEGLVKGLPTFTENPDNIQARYIEALITPKLGKAPLRVASIYLPNGNAVGSEKYAYKFQFLAALYEHTANLLAAQEKLVLGGDYNIAPEEIDVYDAKSLDGRICFHPDERAELRKLLNLGLYDAFRALNPHEQRFSWWDYRAGAWQNGKGLRIDHFLLSPEAMDNAVLCDIKEEVRGRDKASDHAPVMLQLAV